MSTEAAAPSALFVHGAGGGGWEWTVWKRVFAAHGWRTAAPDLLPTPGGLAVTRLPDYLAQTVAAAGALPPPRVLVGASLGGLLALMAAERVAPAALVLVNPLPPAPFAAELPACAPHPAIVPWGREATLAGTRRALPDADEATCLYAFRRWRDESGAVLNAARAGIEVAPPACPVLAIASSDDEDVPPTLTARFADAIGADLLRVPGSHVGPLLGRQAAAVAAQTVAWLNARAGFSRT
ncbi:alpha/beta hydrolase [Rehaibacterium terrae]|uniref:Pimeloyl-ACP methyl ester carboxylesterase n=1 Tax=Rehaibacterium terrae TaxID=1341696 RepID=A0A7W8DF67_9GAMM|nr:alpha/beta fold hydrolase [Rehaibacterium terrae]MBB5015979.1 pimeloyl-ACP methyl ester carboxylesterase [Rehaibacterium terrae]